METTLPAYGSCLSTGVFHIPAKEATKPLIGTIGKMALSLNNYIYVVQKVGELMELSSDYRPETCSTLGLDCGTCVHAAAASIARICHGLESHGVQQIFFQLYPSPGCQPMAEAFALAYKESLNSQRPRLAFAMAAA